MKASAVQQEELLPVSRRWIPGHKRLLTPRGEVRRGSHGVAEGYDVACKCGWSTPSPCATTMEASDAYGQHFRAVAGSMNVQSIPARRAFKIRGHRNVLTALGEVSPRKGPSGGWVSACICGWKNIKPCRTKRSAKDAYGNHLDQVVGDDWPVCKRCAQITRPSQMSKGSPHLCKPCRTAATREWAERNPDDWERHLRKSHLKRKYGITVEEADALLEKQGGKCAICSVTEGDSRGFRMHIDHDHATGVVRGILCNLCNSGLGQFRDNPDLLTKAIAYLAASEERKTA